MANQETVLGATRSLIHLLLKERHSVEELNKVRLSLHALDHSFRHFYVLPFEHSLSDLTTLACQTFHLAENNFVEDVCVLQESAHQG